MTYFDLIIDLGTLSTRARTQARLQRERAEGEARQLQDTLTPSGASMCATTFTRATGTYAAYRQVEAIAHKLTAEAVTYEGDPARALEQLHDRLLDAREFTPRGADRAWASAYEGALESLAISLTERDDVFRGLFTTTTGV